MCACLTYIREELGQTVYLKLEEQDLTPQKMTALKALTDDAKGDKKLRIEVLFPESGKVVLEHEVRIRSTDAFIDGIETLFNRTNIAHFF